MAYESPFLTPQVASGTDMGPSGGPTAYPGNRYKRSYDEGSLAGGRGGRDLSDRLRRKGLAKRRRARRF